MWGRRRSAIEWPDGKSFALTIVDDTDNDLLSNTRPVYDLLIASGMRTTKTVWVYPPRPGNPYVGKCLKDAAYREWILSLRDLGFEIALHNVGSGTFTRHEILAGIREFASIIGHAPRVQINHASNPDNMYWGSKRFAFPVNLLHSVWTGSRFHGDELESPFFWGDVCRESVKYMRNRVFDETDTLAVNPDMPYFDEHKEYANFWFSSSDGRNAERFNALLSPARLKRLEGAQGACIVYTHFASGFVEQGEVNPDTRRVLEHVSSRNGWFVPVSELLDWLLEKRYLSKKHALSWMSQLRLDGRWLLKKLRDERRKRLA